MLSEEKRIHSKAQLKEWLAIEYARYPIHGRRWFSYLLQISEKAILHRHIKLLRTTEYHLNTGHKLRAAWYYAQLMRLQNRYSMHIPVNCFGKGLVVSHIYPLLINGEVKVGECCRIMPGVKLVGDNTPEDRTPVIGDHVTLGAGCIVIGGVELADGITVGAGAVVTKSFLEPGITIAGVPARKTIDRSGIGDK